MIKALSTFIHATLQIVHLDTHAVRKKWRFVIHTILFWLLVWATFWWTIHEEIIAVLSWIITISYIPFIAIELYHREQWRHIYWYGGMTMIGWWMICSMFWWHAWLNAFWSLWFLSIGRWVRDYCMFIRRRNARSIYNQVSTIGVFLISIVFAVITMRRFQSINFDCSDINFLSTHFFDKVMISDWSQVHTVGELVSSGGRSNYMQLLDHWLTTTSGDTSLGNTIKTQVRNSVIVVMDQKKLYDNSVCDYVTSALNTNYQKPSFFYSWVLLLTFMWLPAARIALIVVATLLSMILRGLQYVGVYRSHTTLVEHDVLE